MSSVNSTYKTRKTISSLKSNNLICNLYFKFLINSEIQRFGTGKTTLLKTCIIFPIIRVKLLLPIGINMFKYKTL